MSTLVEEAVLWSSSVSKTVSSGTIQWSDALTVDPNYWDPVLQVEADNAGTPASGDTCVVYIARSNGDIADAAGGDDFDSDEHGEQVAVLDTYASNTPGEDPARKSIPVQIGGCKSYKIGVLCAQAATRNINVKARMGWRDGPVA